MTSIGPEEAMFRLEVLEELLKRDPSRIKRKTEDQEIDPAPFDLNSYALKYGMSISEMARRLKETLIEDLDEIAKLEKGLTPTQDIKRILSNVDSAIETISNITRRETALIVDGEFGKYVLDLYDSGPGVLAVCPGDHFSFGDVYPCVSALGDLDESIGLERVPDEVKERTALAINIATGNAPFGPGDEGPMPEFERFVAPSLCPLCAAEGKVDTETVEHLDAELDIPDLFRRLRLERTGIHEGDESWRRKLETSEDTRRAVRFLEKRILLNTALRGS